MDKKREMNFNLNNFLLALSFLQDSVEKDIFFTTNNHSKRVAFIALKLGTKFNFTPEEMFDLCAYSLIHNIGLKQAKQDIKQYCEIGEDIISNLPFLCGYKEIIKYHKEFFNGRGVFGLKGDDIPLFSQIISFADTIDIEFNSADENIKNREKIINFVEDNEEKLFSSDIVKYFKELSTQTSFWLDLQNETEILLFIYSTLYDFSMVLIFEDILKITSQFLKVISKDNSFLNRVEKISDFYNFEHKDKLTFLIAASLVNIGKLAIPEKIINKAEKLNFTEYEILKAYPYYTRRALSNIMGFNDVVNWACRVQENINGLGYPYKLVGKDLSLKDRLMANMNIYQALREDRSYRKAFSHKEAIAIMKEKVENLKIDKAITEDIERVFWED